MSGVHRRLCLLGLWACLAWHPAWALDKPSGPVVLSIGGQIQSYNAELRADFDMAMLGALPQHTIVTATPWHPKATRFTGPLLRDLLKVVGAQGKTLQVTALNAYQVELPLSDLTQYDVVLARQVGDQPIRIRDKGPLLIMYPFDQSAALRTQVHYGRAAWQVRRLDVL